MDRIKNVNTENEVIAIPDGYPGINNEFFKRMLTFHGIPIIAPYFVGDYALMEARYLMSRVLEKCDHRISPMKQSNLYIAIVSKHQGLFDPTLENANYIVVDESSVLRDNTRSTLIHEIGHALHHTLTSYEKRQIQSLYEKSAQYYNPSAYAVTNTYEYFAEGFSAYFNAGTPSEKIHNRTQLLAFDNSLFNYIEAIIGKNDFNWTPVTDRLTQPHLRGYTP